MNDQSNSATSNEEAITPVLTGRRSFVELVIGLIWAGITGSIGV
jgi:hypothetical protein